MLLGRQPLEDHPPLLDLGQAKLERCRHRRRRQVALQKILHDLEAAVARNAIQRKHADAGYRHAGEKFLKHANSLEV
ncbi:hypothetical protein D3C71_2087390 [compost metagenome]